MNKFMNGMKNVSNYTYTENGAITRSTSLSGLLDLFALGGAYRNRTDDDCITLFKKAFEENEAYAMKCLFYLRDVRGGQGERRFFRTCMHWLANTHPDAVIRNMEFIPEMGRIDDLYCLEGTKCETEMFRYLKKLTEQGLIELGAIK